MRERQTSTGDADGQRTYANAASTGKEHKGRSWQSTQAIQLLLGWCSVAARLLFRYVEMGCIVSGLELLSFIKIDMKVDERRRNPEIKRSKDYGSLFWARN